MRVAPLCFAASMMAWQSSTEVAMGFSSRVWIPAFSAGSANSRWRKTGVATYTASMSPDSSSAGYSS